MKRIVVLKGNPTPEEQALLFARLQTLHQVPEKEPVVSHSNPLWSQHARSEQLDRWPAHLGDQHWRV